VLTSALPVGTSLSGDQSEWLESIWEAFGCGFGKRMSLYAEHVWQRQRQHAGAVPAAARVSIGTNRRCTAGSSALRGMTKQSVGVAIASVVWWSKCGCQGVIGW
jgi:hypothetical protein